MVDILTGTAFDAPRRMHHAEDGVALEFPSSVSSRARGLLALKAINWKAIGGGDDMKTIKAVASVAVVTDENLRAAFAGLLEPSKTYFLVKTAEENPKAYQAVLFTTDSNSNFVGQFLRLSFDRKTYAIAATTGGYSFAVSVGDEFAVFPSWVVE